MRIGAVADVRRCAINYSAVKSTQRGGNQWPHRRIAAWLTQLFYEQGAAAESRRGHALPLLAQDTTRIPDHIFSGPELPVDQIVRERFFGGTRLNVSESCNAHYK
jgi:hypothetical protein